MLPFNLGFIVALKLISVQALLTSVASLYEELQLGPPDDALVSKLSNDIHRRVPLSTNDDTPSPLIDLQVYSPPHVPQGGDSCQVTLLTHEFGDGSYGVPATVDYSPPIDKKCGPVGEWSGITLNVTVYSIGTQYDRLSSLYLSHVEILRHSSAEPTKTGTTWTVKDVTHYRALFAKSGQLLMDFGNIISVDLGLDATFQVTIIATFYPPTQGFTQPVTADIILPLSTLSQSEANFFTIQDDQGGTTNLTLPRTTQKAFIEIYASGNSNEEFWYTNTPDEFLPFFPASTGLIGKGPFREIQVAIDDEIAGVVWPYAVIYSGGITPTNWRPLTAYGTYNQPTYYLDVTPFLPTLANGLVHSIVLRLLGQGTNPSINSNWFVSGSLHLQLGSSPVSGSRRVYDVGPLKVQTTGQVTPGNVTVLTNIMASRHIVVESEIYDDRGLQIIRFEQNLHYRNDQNYTDSGWVQWVSQISHGTTQSTHGQTIVLNDEFSYPLSVFSNYSLYEMQFGSYNSAINQTYNRTLQSPFANTESITFSIQHAEGEVGMDDAPGLRHAINGTGATDQKFAFRLSSGESYFRDIEARNDGWVRDTVWGSLKNLEPPVPMNQILPGGGHGFRRRSLDRRTRMKLMK